MAAAACLRKKDFRKPDKTPRTYVREPFRLDGCIDLDISFDGKTMKTTVYVKMDAQDQLLLSEGVCRQLGIVMYSGTSINGHLVKAVTYCSTASIAGPKCPLYISYISLYS